MNKGADDVDLFHIFNKFTPFLYQNNNLTLQNSILTGGDAHDEISSNTHCFVSILLLFEEDVSEKNILIKWYTYHKSKEDIFFEIVYWPFESMVNQHSRYNLDC